MRKEVILHLHAPAVEWLFDQVPKWLVQWLLLGVKRVVALSGICAQEIQRRYPQARVEVVPKPATLIVQDLGGGRSQEPESRGSVVVASWIIGCVTDGLRSVVVLANRALRDELGRNGVQYVHSHHSADGVGQKYIEVFESL
ncbi:MAG TPA: hypothetical protein VNA25_07155 [Phycisphaerae bacterium]|nr:hypothetical protein [Phycisphaerae bacterium]